MYGAVLGAFAISMPKPTSPGKTIDHGEVDVLIPAGEPEPEPESKAPRERRLAKLVKDVVLVPVTKEVPVTKDPLAPFYQEDVDPAAAPQNDISHRTQVPSIGGPEPEPAAPSPSPEPEPPASLTEQYMRRELSEPQPAPVASPSHKLTSSNSRQLPNLPQAALRLGDLVDQVAPQLARTSSGAVVVDNMVEGFVRTMKRELRRMPSQALPALRNVVRFRDHHSFDMEQNCPADIRRVFGHLKERFGEEYALVHPTPPARTASLLTMIFCWPQHIIFTIRTAEELHRAWHMTLLTSKLMSHLKNKFKLRMTWELGVLRLKFRIEDGDYELHRKVPYDYDSEFQDKYMRVATALINGMPSDPPLLLRLH